MKIDSKASEYKIFPFFIITEILVKNHNKQGEMALWNSILL